jgi:hypothetical protein
MVAERGSKIEELERISIPIYINHSNDTDSNDENNA